MLDRLTVDTLATLDDIAAMKFSDAMVSDESIALLGFQRTRQISAHSRKSWMAGDPAPLRQEARERRHAIFNGALLEMYCEHLPLRQFLDSSGAFPKSVIDIGCGQALPDLFIHRDCQPRFTLVDIEQTDAQYHAWAAEGSGYASLADAKAMLHDNGVAETGADTINPLKDPGAMQGLRADMVTSYYSCGFHYFVDDYADLMVETLENGGRVCLDLRKRYMRRRPEPLARVLDAGEMHELFEDPRSKRILLTG